MSKHIDIRHCCKCDSCLNINQGDVSTSGGSRRRSLRRRPTPCSLSYRWVRMCNISIPNKKLPIPRGIDLRTPGNHQPALSDIPKAESTYQVEGWEDHQSDPYQLADIYMNIRRKNNAERFSQMPHSAAPKGSRRYKRERRYVARTVNESMEDLIQAISAQPTIQNLIKRCKSIPTKGRGLPDLGLEQLGCELKMRLASRAPAFINHPGFNNRIHMISDSQSTRYVPLYEIDSEDDAEITCYLKLQGRKRATRKQRSMTHAQKLRKLAIQNERSSAEKRSLSEERSGSNEMPHSRKRSHSEKDPL